jgi:hypothetical protein
VKKLLLAGMIALAPFAALAVDDGIGSSTLATSGTGSSTSSANSNSSVSDTQGTKAGVSVSGNQKVIVGDVAGNSTADTHTSGGPVKAPGPAFTDSTGQATGNQKPGKKPR